MSLYVTQATVKTDMIGQEINELVESVRLERRKYNENQIIKNVAFACAKESSGLGAELQSKVYGILLTAGMEQGLQLAGSTLLGLKLNLPDLTYEEKEKLREAVQQGLMEKRRGIIKELLELGIPVEDGDWSAKTRAALSLNTRDVVLIDLKNQLNRKQELYGQLLQELAKVLEHIVNLKVKVLPDATDRKIQACKVQSELLLLQTELVTAKSRVGIFAETGKSLDAYKEILKDILQQQIECKQDLEKLQELKEKYKQVSCKQYDEILKSYLQYKASIEKQRLFNQLENK